MCGSRRTSHDRRLLQVWRGALRKRGSAVDNARLLVSRLPVLRGGAVEQSTSAFLRRRSPCRALHQISSALPIVAIACTDASVPSAGHRCSAKRKRAPNSFLCVQARLTMWRLHSLHRRSGSRARPPGLPTARFCRESPVSHHRSAPDQRY